MPFNMIIKSFKNQNHIIGCIKWLNLDTQSFHAYEDHMCPFIKDMLQTLQENHKTLNLAENISNLKVSMRIRVYSMTK